MSSTAEDRELRQKQLDAEGVRCFSFNHAMKLAKSSDSTEAIIAQATKIELYIRKGLPA